MSSSHDSEPTLVTPRLPPSGKKFPCQKCGARLDFDPSERALKCPYCGFVEEIAAAPEQVQERDWDAFWQNQAGAETTLAGHSCEVTCQACNAVVLLEDKVATDRCPYCGTHLENQPESAHRMIAPEGVLPFAVPRKQAVESFNRWIASRWFAPNSLRNFANLGHLAGVYVPYWTFDAMTYTHYTGQRGDNYTDREEYTERDANGQIVTKTRTVTKTRWTWVSGRVDHFFDDVLVCASHSLPKEFVAGLEPWDLPRLEGFKPEFLSSFQTERYGVGLKDGFGQAQEFMDYHIRQLCCQDIGGDHQRLDSVTTQHMGVTFKHILLPVWLAAYRHLDKPYRILVNARTGTVVGSRPYSWVKITLFVFAILVAVLAAFLIFRGVAGGAEPVQPHGTTAFSGGSESRRTPPRRLFEPPLNELFRKPLPRHEDALAA